MSPPNRCPPRAARPATPSSRPPGSCSPSAAFTAPPWPTSPRRRASPRRCSTGTSTTRRTCWPSLAESFLHDIVEPSGTRVPLPDSPEDTEFFTTVVTGYWNLFKQNIGIMIAVAQLGATQPRFAKVQHEFRRFGMDMVADSVRRAQRTGLRARISTPSTSPRRSRCCSRTSPSWWCGNARFGTADQRCRRHQDPVDDLEEDAVRPLSQPDQNRGDHRGFRFTRSPSGPAGRDGRVHRGRDQAAGTREHAVLRPPPRVRPHRSGERRRAGRGSGRTCSTRCAGARTPPGGCATACPRSSAAATGPTWIWPSSGNTWRTRVSACTTICRTSPRSSAISRRSS